MASAPTSLFVPSLAQPVVNENRTITQSWLYFLQQLFIRSGGISGGGFVYTGSVVDFAGSVVPTGYLACDGSAISRTQFAGLFAAIGTAWGAGDGTTTFNLPNLQGAVTLGSSGSHATGSTGGSEATTLSVANLPAHSHTVFDPGHLHSATVIASANTAGASAGSAAVGNTVVAATGISLGNTGSGTPFSNLPPYGVVLKIIKT